MFPWVVANSINGEFIITFEGTFEGENINFLSLITGIFTRCFEWLKLQNLIMLNEARVTQIILRLEILRLGLYVIFKNGSEL